MLDPNWRTSDFDVHVHQTTSELVPTVPTPKFHPADAQFVGNEKLLGIPLKKKKRNKTNKQTNNRTTRMDVFFGPQKSFLASSLPEPSGHRVLVRRGFIGGRAFSSQVAPASAGHALRGSPSFCSSKTWVTVFYSHRKQEQQKTHKQVVVHVSICQGNHFGVTLFLTSCRCKCHHVFQPSRPPVSYGV